VFLLHFKKAFPKLAKFFKALYLRELMKTLHLLPNLLHEQAQWEFRPPKIDALVAESERGGYAYMKRFGMAKVPLYLLNEHTERPEELVGLKEESVGVVSDAGLPCLADPGANLVWAAREQGIEVKAYPGPSSMMLALMLSGLPAQSFIFHGYLEREPALLEKQIRLLPKNITHVFIETPYRNQRMLETLLKTLAPEDRLCVAWNLTGPDEGVVSKRVKAWKQLPDLQKKPGVFLCFKANHESQLGKGQKSEKRP
jgi:16S rRNA (cytidine1402-2'-O)-methyltransferase